MARLARSIVAGIALLAGTHALAADPVAFVSDVKGDVVMDGDGRPAFLAEVLPGTRLELGADAGAAVMFVMSGEEYELRGPGDFVVTREGVKATTGAAPSSRVAGVRPSPKVLVQTSRAATASLRMRSAPAPVKVRSGPLYPVGVRIASLQPTLRWAGDAGATYSVVVTTATGEAVHRSRAKGVSLRLPSPLSPGRRYAWSVSSGDADLRVSRFETLPADAMAVAEAARSGARTFADRVRLALVLADLGAAQDAREVWAELAHQRPDLPELAGLSR